MDTKFDMSNHPIEAAFAAFRMQPSKNNLLKVLTSIQGYAIQDGQFLIPVELPQAAFNMIDPKTVKTGDVLTLQEDLLFKPLQLQMKDGQTAFVAFTSRQEMEKGQSSSIISYPSISFFASVLNEKSVVGAVINPWSDSFFLPKDMIQAILAECKVKTPQSKKKKKKGDITKLDIECIVNAANKSLLGGGGVDGAIHRAAGPDLLKECRTLHGCETGEAKITKGYRLKARYIIHTVGPIYSGAASDAELLANCYHNSMELAKKHNIHSIAFPAISTGVYGYPLEEAIPIAIKTVASWLSKNQNYNIAVVMSCFDQNTYDLYQGFVKSVQSIDT